MSWRDSSSSAPTRRRWSSPSLSGCSSVLEKRGSPPAGRVFHMVCSEAMHPRGVLFLGNFFFALLAAAPGAIAVSLLIALTVSLQPLLSYELDLLLEATVAEEGTTGRVRTLFITAWNIAALVAPLLMGALLAGSDAYGCTFFAAVIALVPFIILFAVRRLPSGAPSKLSHIQD